MPRRARFFASEVGILLAFAALSAIASWPLCAHFGSEIGGDFGDHWQTLWGMWWVHKAIVDLHTSPFFSLWARWPFGMSMVFETFDLPDCLLALPLWGHVPPIAIFNCAEFSSFVLGGYFFYRFAWELIQDSGFEREGSRLAAFLAGCLFTFSPYHFGHAAGYLHLLALEWVPLYFWLLLRTLARPERRWPILAAGALALASLASWYYLLFCVVLTFPYLAWRAAADRKLRTLAALRRALLLGSAYLALLWPLFAELMRQRALEPWAGAHDPVALSADLLSFFVPGATQAIGASFHALWGRFSGSPDESCDYLGYALLALALAGAVTARRARIWLGLALTGAVLALGPRLRVGGVVHPGTLLPYGWLTRWVPLLDFAGCPVRAGFVASFSLSAAAALGLAWLLVPSALRPPPVGRRLAWRRAGAAALLLGAAVEFWPGPFTTSRFPTPEIFRRWAADPTTFAVLDLSGDTRPLYDGVLHGHPLVDAYVSRAPVRLQRWLDTEPVIGRLRNPRHGLAPLDRAAALDGLRRHQIRYVVLPEWSSERLLEAELGLQPLYVGEGLRIYEIPGAGGAR